MVSAKIPHPRRGSNASFPMSFRQVVPWSNCNMSCGQSTSSGEMAGCRHLGHTAPPCQAYGTLKVAIKSWDLLEAMGTSKNPQWSEPPLLGALRSNRPESDLSRQCNHSVTGWAVEIIWVTGAHRDWCWKDVDKIWWKDTAPRHTHSPHGIGWVPEDCGRSCVVAPATPSGAEIWKRWKVANRCQPISKCVWTKGLQPGILNVSHYDLGKESAINSDNQ